MGKWKAWEEVRLWDYDDMKWLWAACIHKEAIRRWMVDCSSFPVVADIEIKSVTLCNSRICLWEVAVKISVELSPLWSFLIARRQRWPASIPLTINVSISNPSVGGLPGTEHRLGFWFSSVTCDSCNAVHCAVPPCLLALRLLSLGTLAEPPGPVHRVAPLK